MKPRCNGPWFEARPKFSLFGRGWPTLVRRPHTIHRVVQVPLHAARKKKGAQPDHGPSAQTKRGCQTSHRRGSGHCEYADMSIGKSSALMAVRLPAVSSWVGAVRFISVASQLHCLGSLRLCFVDSRFLYHVRYYGR